MRYCNRCGCPRDEKVGVCPDCHCPEFSLGPNVTSDAYVPKPETFVQAELFAEASA
jgi:hypothetical protein